MPIIYGNVAGIIHRDEQPQAAKASGPMKRCFKCKRLLPYDAFSIYKNGRRAVKCDECTGRNSKGAGRGGRRGEGLTNEDRGVLREMQGKEVRVRKKDGRPIIMGKCPDCGATICRIGAMRLG